MRIAQLANALAIDQVGGLQRYVGDLSDQLAARGHEVTVITRRLTPDLLAEEWLPSGVRLIRTPVPERSRKSYALRYPVEATLGARRALRGTDFDVVHAHFGMQGLGCRLAGRPYQYTFHAPAWAEINEERGGRYAWPKLLDSPGANAFRALERAAVRGAGETIVLSEFMRAQLRELAGVELRTTAIPGGVDTDYFCPGAPASLSADPWAGHSGPVLFCARRLVPRMGVQNLIAALAQLPRDDVRLAVAGTGFMRDELRAQIAALGLEERVRLLGRVPDAQLRDWYRRATLVVIPTAHLEGFGLSAAEAFACGTPVVGTPAGALPEVLGPVDAQLISAGTGPAGLAAALGSALGRTDLAALGARGREVAVREWSWAAVVGRHEALYQTLCHQSSVASSA
jgi:glycosyltransferase involved in cell wall biosynthesis